MSVSKPKKQHEGKQASHPKLSGVEKQLVAKAASLSMAAKALHPKMLRDFAKRLQPIGPKGWSLVSATDDKVDSTAELMMYRSALASVYGSKPVPFVIPLSQAATTAGGVLNAVYQMNVSSAPEWVSLQALFDEWEPLHGHCQFNAQYSAIPSGLAGGNCCLAIGYDPSDGTVASTVRDICELKQHQLYRPVAEIGPTGTVVSTSFRTAGGCDMMHFKYDAKGVANEPFTAAGVIEVMDGWRTTKTTGATASTFIGYVKYYAEMAFPAAAVAVMGIWYHTIRLRSRT